MRTLITPARRRTTLTATCLTLILAGTTLVSAPAVADGVSVVDPQTGHRVRLPDNDRDGRADYVPKRLDVHVSPGLTYPRETREQRPSGGGSICHGNDGGSTVSTARRSCNPSAPAGDGGAWEAPDTSTSSPSTPTRPSTSSSTRLN
ncbi:hypothetical protein F0A16_05190 [Salinicola corii]|uniref:Secreted protein n=1 Tax=Salinicola corii TaxID=2606937 RepID=A0A640WH39_9GAMM|nr:hypothetical protein [Salinicola corii]KAA0019723.1 hypothetical protein F0A16_05190 [Salinicola corii]